VGLVLRVGLEPQHLHRRVSELSGGQQQRVGIARAFLCDPDLLLADEPVASLDPATSGEILALLHEAARERRTTVLCSLHQPELATRFADRILGLRAGRVVFDGPPDRLDQPTLARIYGQGFGAERLELAA
jgi:phosphonate transport system ATP-binding protein